MRACSSATISILGPPEQSTRTDRKRSHSPAGEWDRRSFDNDVARHAITRCLSCRSCSRAYLLQNRYEGAIGQLKGRDAATWNINDASRWVAVGDWSCPKFSQRAASNFSHGFGT